MREGRQLPCLGSARSDCGRIWQQELTGHGRIKTLIADQPDETG